MTFSGTTNYIAIAGLTIFVLYILFSIITFSANRILRRKGNHAPCVWSLIKTTHEALCSSCFITSSSQIVIYKSMNSKKLEVFAYNNVQPPISESTLKISRENENENEGMPGESWFKNLNPRTEKDKRTPVVTLRNPDSTDKMKKTKIILPLVVKGYDDPWGVFCFYSPKTLTQKDYQQLLTKLNSDDGIIASFESLLEKQNLSGHYINFVK